MIQFAWSKKYEINDPLIDGQHQYLFLLANSINDSMTHKEIKKMIMKLFVYTRKHFVSEEVVMKEEGYPLYEQHKKQHEDLVTLLSVTSQKMKENKYNVDDLKALLFKWISDHILDKDMQFFNFINNK